MHPKIMFSIEFSMGNQKKSPAAQLDLNDFIRIPPLITNPGIIRGGILIKGGILNNNTSDGNRT